ncbi:hypothetical protein [Desulfobacula phenolica]|uniref:Uncharacterized protein n=1 Tax=Desulfobacula phenolica TaxID=90732 RepID=A0A1H2KEW7_9BACT|nr:hypothetical protein [Desulfobacula phenolica]SDU67229.1 hypothetical protein SAMN04487931_1386 [Desulfobacula phenolica]
MLLLQFLHLTNSFFFLTAGFGGFSCSRRLRRLERGADFVQPLVPVPCAGTRSWTGQHRVHQLKKVFTIGLG